MKRLAGCVAVSLFASAAGWAGCHGDFGLAHQPATGTGTGMIDAFTTLDTAGEGTGTGTDAGIDADGSGTGTGTDAGIDAAGSGTGTDAGIDAAGSGTGTDAGIDAAGSGTGTDAGIDAPENAPGTDASTDAAGTGTDGSGGGTGGGLHGSDSGDDDVTSFYACRGRCGSAGADTGLPIALAVMVALRRRRRA